MRIDRLPGTRFRLRKGWRVYFDTGRYSAPPNQCVSSKFDVEWKGNLVLVKHRRKSNVILPVLRSDGEVADLLLALWVFGVDVWCALTRSSWLKEFVGLCTG